MILRVLGVGALGTGLAAYYVQQDQTYSRSFKLWTKLGPIISHYRLVEFKQKFVPATAEEQDLEYLDLHKMYADQVLAALLDLRGFYVKVGQVMAHRNDILHELYIEKLRILEDQVPPPLTPEQAKSVIVESLGLKQLGDVFDGFQDKPLGSASIGQVHKAFLKNGTAVAIKIQDPNAEALFRTDIQAARNFCRTFAPEQLIIFDEIEKQFLTEFDYTAEASHLQTVRHNMRHFKNVVVPKPFLDLCSKNVLTMEFLKGPKLVDGIRENSTQYAKTLGMTLKELETKFRREQALAFKDSILNTPVWLINLGLGCVRFVTGFHLQPFQYYKSFIPLNSSYIMDTLLKVHGHQLLVDGFFNADGHPGNFLLLENGKIALIDYGQVKKVDEQDRKTIARLVLAIADRDKEEVANIMFEIGAKSKHMNKDVMFRMAIVGFDQDGRNVTDAGLNLQQFMDKQFAIDPWEKFADNMIMPMRLSLLLRGVGLMLGHPVSVCTAWKPIAEQALK
ncbi:ABC1 family-domain-containing protein [Gorgonomyces haynaldii]|nr:ABC1 family-domain-containing protein [Gorgonomyces haynaldii]